MTDWSATPPSPAPVAHPGRDVTAVMGRRIAAWVIDLAIYLGLVVALFASLAEFSDVPSGFDSLEYCDALEVTFPDEASTCVPIGDRVWLTSESDSAVIFLAAVGYFGLFVLVQGLLAASPGKLVTGLRVVDQHGEPAGIGKSIVRTLLWVVDGAPWFAPLVGFIVGLTSTGHRRVGDMAAGTYVVAARDVGAPVTTGGPLDPPPGQTPWGAPPGSWPPPSTPPPAIPPPGAPVPDAPAPRVDDLAPEISGVPAEQPAPPPLLDDAPPSFDAPEPPPGDDPTAPPPEPPTTPEIDGAVDEATPHIGTDPEWWSGPEAEPSSAPEIPDEPAPPTLPEWADPSIPVEDTDWAPPTTPGPDFEETTDTSPTAGPSPFVAPGADPRSEAPPTGPEPTPMPPPQWDPARNTYIQWHPQLQQWLRWDTASNRWIDIDT